MKSKQDKSSLFDAAISLLREHVLWIRRHHADRKKAEGDESDRAIAVLKAAGKAEICCKINSGLKFFFIGNYDKEQALLKTIYKAKRAKED